MEFVALLYFVRYIVHLTLPVCVSVSVCVYSTFDASVCVSVSVCVCKCVCVVDSLPSLFESFFVLFR